MQFNIKNLAWEKMQGLIPAIVQDAQSRSILMLGYMNEAALMTTIETKRVTFFSREKNRLWTKGETSGNQLQLQEIISDCDNDALLIIANPLGPTCHTGEKSCFRKFAETDWEIIQTLEKTIEEREQLRPENSYTTTLFNAGLSRIAQKVGEESVEVVIAAMKKNKLAFSNEVADLLYHLLVLLKAKEVNLSQIIKLLAARNQ